MAGPVMYGQGQNTEKDFKAPIQKWFLRWPLLALICKNKTKHIPRFGFTMYKYWRPVNFYLDPRLTFYEMSK